MSNRNLLYSGPRKGGIKSRPTTPKPNVRPSGVKPKGRKTSLEEEELKKSILLKSFIGDIINREVLTNYTPKSFQHLSQKEQKMKEFTRKELQEIRDKAEEIAISGPTDSRIRIKRWERAYRQLADAADRLDAMIARTEQIG